MAAPTLFFADLVRERCTGTGTGALALDGALPGHRPFAGTVPPATLFHYSIAGVHDPAQWEAGTGRMAPDGRLERVSVAASSNGGTLVDFGPGLKTVALTVGAGWFTGASAPPGLADVIGLQGALDGKLAVGAGFGTGSAAAPSVHFAAHPGTGLFAGGTHILALSTSGVERMRVQADGLIGMGTGTAALSVPLEVRNANPVVRIASTASDAAVLAGIEMAAFGTVEASIKARGNTGELNIASGRSVGWGGHIRFFTDMTERWRIEPMGTLRPASDNITALGNAAFRVSTVFAASGTINTSDARDKTDAGPVPELWLDAWAAVGWCRYRFRDGKRWHVGLIAQEVHAAFAGFGIDAFAIGLLCRDPVDGAEGRSDRWGLRYEECLALEAAWQRREIARLSARLAKRRIRKVAA